MSFCETSWVINFTLRINRRIEYEIFFISNENDVSWYADATPQ